MILHKGEGLVMAQGSSEGRRNGVSPVQGTNDCHCLVKVLKGIVVIMQGPSASFEQGNVLRPQRYHFLFHLSTSGNTGWGILSFVLGSRH